MGMAVRKRCVVVLVLSVLTLGGCVRDPVAGRATRAADGDPRTGRFTLEIAAKGAGRDVLLAADGAFDHHRRRYALEVSGRLAASPAVPRRTIAIDDVLYVDFPALAHRLGAPTPWIRVVEGDVDGLGLRRFAPDRMLAMASSSDATVERDGDGLVRRITMRFDAPGEDRDVLLTVTYADLGTPVAIEPPPADQVTEATESARRSGERTGG